MRRGLTACLYALAVLAVLALLPSLAARAEIVFPQGEDDLALYLEYTAGQPLTIKIEAPHYSTAGKALRYEWRYVDNDDEDPIFTPIATTSEPSLTFTPLASDHRRMVQVVILEEGTDEDWNFSAQTLLDRARDYPQLPKETGSRWHQYELCKGENVTLTLPEATVRNSGKTLEYRWYAEWAGGGYDLQQATASPKLTVQNDDTHNYDFDPFVGYWCEVGYKGEEDTFLQYDAYFDVFFYPFADFRATLQGEPKVPDVAREKLKLNTVAELETFLFEQSKEMEPYLKDVVASRQLYEVKFEIKQDDGTWSTVTEDTYPLGGMPVTLPYPEGTDSGNYDFLVAAELLPTGKVAYYPYYVFETPEGLRLFLDHANPVLVIWHRSTDTPQYEVSTDLPPTVPDAVAQKLQTVTELELFMFDKAKDRLPSPKDETASYHLYEVELHVLDGSGNRIPVTADNFPSDGILVPLPYPKGTEDYWNYDFVVGHMLAEDHGGLKAGEIEYPTFTKTPEGLQVLLKSTSPVLVAWQRSADAAPVSVPKTGDATPLGALTALLALSAFAMAALIHTSRKKRA